MNILFLTHVGDPGGAEYKMMNMAEAVSGQCDVLHFQHGTLEKILPARGIASSLLPLPPAVTGFRREDGLKSLLKAIPAAIQMIFALARKCRHYKVIVCMSQKSFVLAALAKPFMRRPIVWFMNDIVSPDHFSRAALLIIKILSRVAADEVVLNSQASLDAWIKAGCKPTNLHVIYPGTDPAAIERQISDKEAVQRLRLEWSPDGAPLIGIFGRLTSWKGQDVFLRALARLDSVRGVIVGAPFFGEEPFEISLKKLSEELGLSGRVTFAGHIDTPATAMAACDIVAHCSTSPEPFGLVIVESMMAGVPVVATDAGGAKEIVVNGESGLLTPMGDDAALASAFQRYLDNTAFAQEIAGNAGKRAEQYFSVSAMTSAFKNIAAKYL